ncbi:unnamed protein product, partial [Pleuronectes platessa]
MKLVQVVLMLISLKLLISSMFAAATVEAEDIRDLYDSRLCFNSPSYLRFCGLSSPHRVVRSRGHVACLRERRELCSENAVAGCVSVVQPMDTIYSHRGDQ